MMLACFLDLMFASYNMERWLSWSKAHDWKSCVRLITDRGFESHSFRQRRYAENRLRTDMVRGLFFMSQSAIKKYF